MNQEELKEDNEGNEIIEIQNRLKQLKYYYTSITGSFDSYTKKVIMKFQKDHDLIPNGIINQETKKVLFGNRNLEENLRETRPTLRLGSTGQYVVELQNLLTNLLYYNETIDGNFGTTTQTAVKMFQVNNNLNPDGIVGRDTWSALSTLYSPLAICGEENEENYITYTVVAGDTLWSLARRFSTTVDAIKSLNNLTSDVILVGQQLLIPLNGNQPENIIYTVVAGDTLWILARRFNTTVDNLKRLNNLTSDNLNIGQKLIISGNTEVPLIYTVVAGDTLWNLARKFNTTVDNLKRLNNLTSDNLNIGQRLIVSKNGEYGL